MYLLQEQFSAALRTKGDLGKDGHYFVTKEKITVAYTRCWNWQKGFKGDSRASERRATTMLQGLPQAMSEALDARRVSSPEDQEEALPGGELICDDVQNSITNNTFDDIMDVIKQEQHYACWHFVGGRHALHTPRPAATSGQAWLSHMPPLSQERQPA